MGAPSRPSGFVLTDYYSSWTGSIPIIPFMSDGKSCFPGHGVVWQGQDCVTQGSSTSYLAIGKLTLILVLA